MYWVEKATDPDAKARALGIAHTKVEPDIAVVDRLVADGYLVKIKRERWMAIWITAKGTAEFGAHLASVKSSPTPVDPEKQRAMDLRDKLVAGTITSLEKVELIDLILKRITI